VCYDYIWNLYWHLRSDGAFLCSELLAYKTLTGDDIGKFETNELLLLHRFVEGHKTYKTNSKSK